MKNSIQMPVKILIVLCLINALIISNNTFAKKPDSIGGIGLGVVNYVTKAQHDAAIADLQDQITALRNEINAGTYEIGDILSDGSIVFWIDKTGRHGLAAWPVDALEPGNGNDAFMNWWTSKEVVENYGPGWRLPTKYELNLLYQQSDVVGGFAVHIYWSSTEYLTGLAWAQGFFDGYQVSSFGKDSSFKARAVRNF